MLMSADITLTYALQIRTYWIDSQSGTLVASVLTWVRFFSDKKHFTISDSPIIDWLPFYIRTMNKMRRSDSIQQQFSFPIYVTYFRSCFDLMIDIWLSIISRLSLRHQFRHREMTLSTNIKVIKMLLQHNMQIDILSNSLLDFNYKENCIHSNFSDPFHLAKINFISKHYCETFRYRCCFLFILASNLLRNQAKIECEILYH